MAQTSVLSSYNHARAGHTLERGPESTSVRYENVEATEVGHRRGHGLRGLADIAHVCREGENIGRRSLEQYRVLARIECLLLARYDRQGCTTTGELQGRLEADAAGSTSDQDNLPSERLRLIMDFWVD
jgi:hypothetical protein